MNPAAKQTAPPVARENRMTLNNIQKGKRKAALRILVYGVDGVGKSTFAAQAPSPVFLGTEDGSEHLDVARFPAPQSWEDVLDAVATLTADPGNYRTLVLDSVDWAEPLLWRGVCEQDGASSIEKVGGGYGKGYVAALDGWRVLLAALERLQRERGLNVILLGHAFIKTFKNPEADDFDRYILKLHDKSAALLREWVSGVYFCNFETLTVEKDKRIRGVSSGARLMWTQRTAAFDAKDRYGLPETLPLSWADFAEARERGQPADAEALRAEIERKAAGLSPELAKTTRDAIERAGGDAGKLAQLNSWVNAKLAMAAGSEEAA